MSTFTVTHQQITDNVCVVQTLESTDILVGQEITLSGCDATINGVHTVFQIPIYYFIGINTAGDYLFNDQIVFKNQILFQLEEDNIQRSAVDPVGSLQWTTPTECVWADVPALEEFLGIAGATANDTAFMTTSVNAANAWCFKRRSQAGYKDSLVTVPDAAVLSGTVLMAASLYRERGSIDSFNSFQDMTISAPVASMGRINSLLGIKRAQVA
jgi:hypothetical protein